jgi:excisionase family DNA binding protein
VTSPYLTVREVAELARCEHKAVRRAITAGRLRAFQPVNRLLIREDDARAWIEGRLVTQAAECQPARRRASSSSRAAARGSVADLKAIERQVTAT